MDSNLQIYCHTLEGETTATTTTKIVEHHQQQEQLIVQQQQIQVEQQQEQHEQYREQEIQYIQKTEQEQQFETIMKKDKKSKKLKKPKHKLEQEQEIEIEQEHEQILEQYEQKQEETIVIGKLKRIKTQTASEEDVQTIVDENIEKMLTPTLETLPLQSLPQDTVETIATTELPLMAPVEKPKPQLAQEKYILQHSVLVQENDQVMEVEKPAMLVKEFTVSVSETVEGVELKVPSTEEIVTEQTSHEMAAEQPKSAKATSNQDLKKHKPLVVEKPLIEESAAEELPLVRDEQHAVPEIEPLQALKHSHVIVSESIDKLDDKKPKVKGEQVKTEIVSESSIVVEQVFSTEALEKELTIEKPKSVDVSQVIVPSETSIEIEEVLTHDTTKDWKKSKQPTQDKPEITFVAHKSLQAKEVVSQEKEQVLEKLPSPLPAKALKSVKDVSSSLEIMEPKTNEMVIEMPAVKPEPSAKATDKLVLLESIQATQPDLQSPLEEYKSSYIEIKKEASITVDAQKHLTGFEEFIDEAKPLDLHLPEIATNQAQLHKELRHLPTNEVSIAETTEHVDELKPKEIIAPQKGKTSMTNGNTIGETMQDQLYESLLENDFKLPATEQVKSHIDTSATVATVSHVQIQDKEDVLEPTEPQTIAAAKTRLTEQPNAITIFSQQTVESEQEIKPMEKPEMQIAHKLSNITELKAPVVDLNETQANTKPLQEFQPKAMQATTNMDANVATLTTDTTLMDTHEFMQAAKTEALNLKSQFMTNLNNLEIYEVNITENFKEQPQPDKPSVHQAIVQQDELKLKSLETREIVILETSTDSDIKIESAKIAPTTNYVPHHASEISSPMLLHLTGALKDIQTPDVQRTQTEMELVQPLDISITQIHEKESILPAAEKPSSKEVTTSSTNLLNIAQTFTEQTIEHSDDFAVADVKAQHGHYNIVEGITTALSSLIEGMDSIDECDSQSLNATQLTNITVVENKAVNIEMVTATEKETTSAEFRKPTEFLADAKLSDDLFKAPLIKEEEFYETSNKFQGIVSLEAQVQIKETENLRELSVQDISVYENEQSLDIADLNKTQEAQINITAQPQIAITLKEQLLEASQDFKTKTFTTDLAQTSTHDIALKVPLTEGVQQQDTVTELKEFDSTSHTIKPIQNPFNETVTSETLILENFEDNDVKLPQMEERPQEILQETNKYAVVENAAMIFEHEQQLGDVKEAPRQAKNALTDTHNLPVFITQGLMESTGHLKEFEANSHTAKTIADEKGLIVGTTDKSLLLDSVTETLPEKQIKPVTAQVDHVGNQGVIVETQQTAEFEGIIAPTKLESTEIPTVATSQEHRLPLIEETKSQELTAALEYAQPIFTKADFKMQDSNKELTVTEIQAIEESKILEYEQKPLIKINIAVDERFMPAQVETMNSVLQKEEDIRDFKPHTETAKSFVEGTLREMITTKPTAYEETPELSMEQPLTTTAKTFTDDTTKQSHLMQFQTVMQSAADLTCLPQDKYQAKSTLQGSQREVQVSQVTTTENTDNFESFPLTQHKAMECVSEVTSNAKTILTTTVLEKETNILTQTPIQTQVIQPTTKEEVNEKLITEVITCEGTTPLKDTPELNKQLATVSMTTTTQEIKQIQDEPVYLKEAEVEALSLKPENANIVQDKFKAVLAEETLGLSSITETYEFTKRTEQHATVVKDTPNLQVQLVQSTTAYEEPNTFSTKLEEYVKTLPILIERETKTVQSHIIQPYENIGEQSGDFKPTFQDSKTSLVLPDFKASTVEEVLTQTDVSKLDILQISEQIKPVHSQEHSDKLMISTVTPFETLKNIPEKDQTQQKANVGLSDAMVTSTSTESHTSTISGEFEWKEPISLKPFTEIQTQNTQTAETITPTSSTITEITESLDDQEKHKTYTVTYTSDEKRIQEQTKDEKPVFITTFKSVQNEDGETVIETENKKVTQEEGVLVEEVLSDTETAIEQDDEETSPSNIEIVEVSDITGEEAIVHKDYQINVIEEEPEEKEEDEEKPEIVTIEERPEEAEESHPIEVVEEEEEVPAATEETVEDTTKPKKTKKKVVKKKTDDHDAIIQKLLEQDIEKTELEKYEKVEFDKPKKAKPEMSKLVPIKIERREQKPKKVVIVDAAEVPQMVKLKPSKRKEKPTEEQAVQLPKFKLKSRMVVVEYPPEALKPVITEIGALKSAGDLSRNIEEAEALLQFKPYKPKKIKKIKDNLEKVELEKYEKYVSSEEEPEEKAPYKKPQKPSKPEEKQEEVQIKLGKGKKKPKEEEQPESITLKKIPQKPQLAEEVTEEKTVKKHAVIVKEEDAKPEEPKYEMKPLGPLEFEDIEYPKEELEPLEFPEEPKKDKKEPKQKHKPKPKSKPEQEMNVTQIVPGEPKKEEEQPEEEVKFRIPESTKDEEPKTERKLKPVKKVKEEAPAEDTVKLVPAEEPKEKSPSPVPQAEQKEVKKPKSKKEKPQEKPKTEEKPDKQFEVSVHEEVVEQETPVEETVDKVKIKKKVPKKEQPIEEVKVVEEVVEKPQQEEIPVEYKITTTVIEPEELPEEHKVRVVDIDAKEVTVEEVIEEKVVTRKKKPKTTVPEEYEFTVEEPKQPEPTKVEETTEEVTVEIQKPQEPTPEEVTVIETITQPIVEETVEEVTTKKKKKPKKKPVEDVATVEVKEETPVEEVVKEIPSEEKVEEVIPEAQKPKDYKFSVTETEAVAQVVEEVKKDEEEKPKPKPKLEKPAEVYPTYEIKTTESEAEKPITVEEEQPEEVKFAIKPKQVKEVPEEFEASVALTEPKLIEETEVETVVKTKKTRKPKKPEEEVAELQVQVVETQEKEIVEEVIEEPKVEEIVPEKPKVRKPDEYKIKVSEEEPVPEEEVPEAQFTVKPKLVQEKPTEEPEAEFVLKESKPVEQVTEEAQIKTKKIKKKPKEEAADELKIKIIEEIPVEKPIEIVEEIEEIEEVPIKKAPEEVPKDYEFKLKEFEIPKEQVVEEIVEEPKPSEEPKPKEEPVKDVKVVTTVPTEEIIQEEVKTVKKKPKKPKEITEEAKVTVVEEIPEKPKPVEVEEKPEEEKPQEVIEEETYPEHQVKVIDETPRYVTEEVEEQEVKIQRKKKPAPKVTEEPEEQVVFAPKKPVEDVAEAKIIKKKPKQKVPEEEQAELKVTITEEIPQETELVQEIEVVEEIEEKPKPQETPKEQPKTYEFSVKDIEPVKIEEVEEVPDEEVTLKKKPKVVQPEITEEPEVEISLKPKPEKQVAPEETAIIKKKSKPKVREEPEAELKIQVREEVSPEPEVQVVEEIEEVFETPKEEPQEEIEEVVFKPKKPKKKEEIIEEDVTIKKPTVKVEEDQVVDVTLKPKKAPKQQEQDVEVDFKLPKEKQITQETSEETVQLKKKKKPVKPMEEAADELVIKQEEVIERPVEIEEEEIIEEAVVMRRKPKKPFKPQVEEHEEEEFSLSFKKPRQIDEGVAEEATVLKRRPKKPLTSDEAAAELHIKREESYDQDEEEDIEEFVVAHKPRPKPRPLQVTEEGEQEYTVKKLKRRKKGVEIPEFTDVENVTFRPKLTKTKEDVDQEFSIALDSYAEEEVSMSGKVKIKKPIKKTYSEAEDEHRIKIMQDYDDGQGPIIEEIRDDSSMEDTMYDVEEPEEYQIEELPLDDVDFTLKPKHKPKPRYSIQDEEEEQFLIGLRRPKSNSVTYDEDSLTFKKKRKVIQQVFNEDGASLNITREMNIEEAEEENIMFSICNYVADSDEAMNLVEGEKVRVVGRHSSEWWFVKKTITEEEGWVPAQYLMEAAEYDQYVQKKLHEKIDKLPVFERPGPHEKPMAPRFIEKLQPIHTPDGYTVQFECKVEGMPRPQIAWFRETAIIKPSQDFQMYYDDDNVATLIIREVFPEDAGRFTCVAKNAAGFTSTTTELMVETPLSDHGSDGTAMSRKSMSRESSLADILEGIPPTFSRKPKAQYVDEDTNVILECRLVAVPEPDIVWTFNGEEIDTTTLKNVRVVTESDMHMYCSVVHIKKVKKSQEGTYEVIATNREGESRLPIVLKVRTNEKEPPQVLEPLRNMIIREGESAVLTTQIVGNPAPKITWYKDGKPVKGNTKTEKDMHTLTLISPKRDQKGEYTVKAENPLGSVETSANLTIEEPPSGNAEPPLFVERFEEQNVPQKGVIRLPAKVTGNPVPEVEWLFNNNPLYPNERIQQVYDGENIELIIKNANPDTDSGDYKCIASNPLGKTSHGARVIVEVDEVVFTKKLKAKITIEEVQSLTLECETSHVVSTKWFFNGKELSGMDHRVVVEEGKTHKLVIKNTNLRDSGNYICKVKDQETKSTVEVLPRKPEFIKPLEDYEVTEKDTAILDVEVSTDVTEMQWFKDGEKITPEKKNVDFIKDGKVHRLLIRNCTIQDEGEYSCKFADQVCKAELTVIELPPEIVKPLEDVTVTEGETATFTVELDKGDALIKWFKNGKEITFDERVQLSIDGKRQTITIKKAKPSDATEYSLKVGEQTSKAKLVVEKPLVEFIVPLPDVTLATKNTDAEFTVKLSHPDVEVTWFKKGKPIKPNKKHEVFVEATVRRLVIHDAEDDDAGEVSCTAANVTTSTNLCVEEVKTAPIIISDKDQTIKVKENDDVTMTIKYTGVPQPDAEWKTSKKVIVKSNRVTPTIDEQSASLTIRKVVEEDEDEYTIKLRNPVGEAEASLRLVIMRKPSAPGAPQPLEVMHDSITLFWKAPEDDGKSDILEYILEYKDVKTEKWSEIRKIKDTTYTLSKLIIDTEYVFRAIAVNEVGPSPPSPLSPPIRLVAEVKKEKPTVQEPLQDITTEHDKEITLSCVFGGVPEPKVVWKKNGKIIQTTTMRYENRVAKYTIKKTTIEDAAEYTCVAENEVGSVETSCRVTLQEKPSIDIEEKYLSLKLRTGSDMTIPALVKAYPKPKVTWYKETTVVKTTVEINEITTTETKTILNIQKLTREDSGRYKLVAENTAGSSSVECNIKVIDKPSRPQSLEIKDVKKDSIKLEWTPPIDDGGLEINKYILEKCEVQNNVWMKVADIDRDITSYCVQKLSMNSQYMFRVVALNPIGESEPTESEPVAITKKFAKPSAPRAPIDVSGMNDTCFTLSWQESESDGGSKIIEYIVEIKEFHETEYRLLGSTNGNVPNILVTNVIKNKAYTFRIYAKNEVGTSEALETEDKIVVSRRIIRASEGLAPPSPPQNLRCPDITGRSVTLDWEIPAHNGGSEITGYCIEKRSSTSTTWTKVITLDAHCLQYTVDNLKEKSEYWFRVSAENEAGLGAPAVTESIALKTHATVPSPPTAPLETRVIAANAHVFEWGIPESDGGAPLLGYHIAIRDMKKSMWIEVGRVPAGVLKFQIRDLQENHEYMIRIFAKNEIGLSEPLESEEPYKAMTSGLASLPDEPRTEMSSCNTSSWLRDHHMDADIHSYARGKLLRRDEYFFRIWAKLPKKKKNSK